MHKEVIGSASHDDAAEVAYVDANIDAAVKQVFPSLFVNSDGDGKRSTLPNFPACHQRLLQRLANANESVDLLRTALQRRQQPRPKLLRPERLKA